jgi:hypothetical protein
MIVLVMAMPIIPVYATAAPTSISVVSAQVVRSTVETGDMFIAFLYKIEYSSYPTEPASDTFSFRLYSADMNTLLASNQPYSVSFNNGYGEGISGFYFDADTAPTWGGEYVINIAASPLYFSPIPDPVYAVLSDGNYTDETTQASNQAVMYSYILDACHKMHTFDADIALTASTDYGEQLSAQGDTYLRAAIPGINLIAPSLFVIQPYNPISTPLSYDNSLQDTYTARLVGSDIMIGAERLGDKLFGVTGQTLLAFFVILLCIGLIVLLTWKQWGVEPGLIGSSIILTAAALLLGDAIWTIRIIMALISGVIIFFLLVFRRA